MKKEMSTGAVAAAVVVVVAVLALVAWRMFSPPPGPVDTPEARAAAKQLAESFKANARQAMMNNSAPTNAGTAGGSR